MSLKKNTINFDVNDEIQKYLNSDYKPNMLSLQKDIKCNQDENFYKKVPGNIITIGDIHGDFKALLYILRTAQMIDDRLKWSGENTTIVFTGDLTDDSRGPKQLFKPDHNEYDVVSILSFLLDLNDQAKPKGGQILICFGNHDFANLFLSASYSEWLRTNYNSNDTNKYNNTFLYTNESFKKKLACIFYPYILLNDKYMFMHGGLIPEFIEQLHAKYKKKASGNNSGYIESMNEYNKDLKKILKGNESTIFLKKTNERGKEVIDIDSVYWFSSEVQIKRYGKRTYLNYNWNRDYSQDTLECDDLSNISLNDLWNNVQRKLEKDKMVLIIGHTPQNDGINNKCDNNFFCIDTAISRAFSDSYLNDQPISITNNLSYLKINTQSRLEFEIFELKPNSKFYNVPTSPPSFTPAEPPSTEKLLRTDEVKVIEVEDDDCSKGMGCGTKTLLCLGFTCFTVVALNNTDKIGPSLKTMKKKISEFFDEVKEKTDSTDIKGKFQSIQSKFKDEFTIVKSKAQDLLRRRKSKHRGYEDLLQELHLKDPEETDLENKFSIDDEQELQLEEPEETAFENKFSIDDEQELQYTQTPSISQIPHVKQSQRPSTPQPRQTIDYSVLDEDQQGGNNRFVVHKINYKDIKFLIDPSFY
jgi:hypothetical protein